MFLKRIIPFFLLLISFCAFFFLSVQSYAQSVEEDLSGSFFRLHILANSNSEEDQALKYLVRDELISYLHTLSGDTHSKESVMELARLHLADFQKVSEKVIAENGYSYPVAVEIGNFPFPTKHYGNLSLPAGSYDALRVTIGKAEGQNWWCVLFPPLCFVNSTTGLVEEEDLAPIEDTLSDDEIALITTEDTDTIRFKFKLVELMQNANSFFEQLDN